MRLDKFISSNTTLSRREVEQAISKGRVFVNSQKALKKDIKIDELSDFVTLDGNVISYKKYVYIMLNKPQGVVSATEDKNDRTVLDLLGESYKKYNLFPAGRLDKDTLGLVILTNDGESAHKNLSPKNHVKKIYEYNCAEVLSDEDKIKIEKGIELKDGYITKPCKIEKITNNSGTITLTEGKYHEIKRMFGATGNKITYLKRISFGEIVLDKSLREGEYRELTEKEIMIFTRDNSVVN